MGTSQLWEPREAYFHFEKRRMEARWHLPRIAAADLTIVCGNVALVSVFFFCSIAWFQCYFYYVS